MRYVGFFACNQTGYAETGAGAAGCGLHYGDAYVDHPSFGIAIISRLIEAEGFSVGIIAQPDWHKIEDFWQAGKAPAWFFYNGGKH